MMKQLNLFFELTRLKRPIGYMLLFWPCAWGLTLAYDFSNDLKNYFFYLTFFFLGSVLMRSAGCIVNDISDKEFDKKVERTKNRPIASNKISINLAIFYTIILCSLAFLVLINFNYLTIILALCSMPLAFTYPLMKRFTYWPQLFLGITFNWGIMMSWTASVNYISLDILYFYLAAIFWTLGYDTIYGAQDINDDEIIGIKSTSVKFKKYIKTFVSINYFLTSLILVILFEDKLGINYFTTFIIIFILSLIYQTAVFDRANPAKCLASFKLNNYSGFSLLLAIMFIK